MIGIPKVLGELGLDEFRLIALTPVLQKLYLLTLLEVYKRTRAPCRANLVGFEEGRSTLEVVEVIRQILFKANEWGKKAYVACADVLQAFDHMEHEVIAKALGKRNLCRLPSLPSGARS